jgi:hypothetical protein
MTGDLEHRKCGLIVSRSQRRAHRDAVQNNTLANTEYGGTCTGRGYINLCTLPSGDT